MGTSLRVLIVEDYESDAQLVLRELKRGGYEVTFLRVETPEAMSAALTERTWDLIISDYSMPRFSALLALGVMKGLKVDLPFIIVSGTVGEDVAVEALHAGAHDFVAKGKLARLIPAIERELRDVALRTQQVKMREQLQISERMASVGTLAAGVAHEINNPLAALVLNLDIVNDDITRVAEVLRSRAAAPSDAQFAEGSEEWIARRLEEIESPLRDARESADRVRRIVRDLKLFSRGNEAKIGAVVLRPVLESSIRIALNEIRHRARLVESYGDVPAVEGNEGQLGQVFLNLLVNAAQSMPEGNANVNELGVQTRLDAQGRVLVEIRDTGSGMSSAVMARIFDPFFTTKPIGEGTGLGLAICHRIITDLGGQIDVESAVGVGTTVTILLPPARDVSVDVATSPEATTPARRGRILMVDDEPMLATAVRRMLASDHEFLAVTNAREALGLIAQGEQFDVILCDLMMPEVTGMELHAELARFAPEQAARMVFMTGGAFTSGARAFLAEVDNARLDKPFDGAHLRELIQSVMQTG